MTARRATSATSRRGRREAIVEVRDRVVGLYGSAFLSNVLLAASAPKDPKQLVTFATRAADTIAAMKPESFPEPKIEGGRPSPKKWAALLSKPAAALEAALADVDREAVEAITALAKRNETRDAFEAFLPKASDLLEGLLRFGAWTRRPTGSTVSSPVRRPEQTKRIPAVEGEARAADSRNNGREPLPTGVRGRRHPWEPLPTGVRGRRHPWGAPPSIRGSVWRHLLRWCWPLALTRRGLCLYRPANDTQLASVSIVTAPLGPMPVMRARK